MLIDQEELVTKVLKVIQDTNQYLKNIYNNDGYYNYENGRINCNGKNQVAPYMTVQIIYNRKNGKSNNEVVEQLLANASFTIHGKEFFQFHKEYKNNINAIFIGDSHIKFFTNLPLVELVFEKQKKTPFFDVSGYEHYGAFVLSDEQSEMIGDFGNSPFNIYLDFDNEAITINEKPKENYLQLIFNKKFMTGYKNTKTLKSPIRIDVYDYNSDKNLYLIKMEVVSDKIITDHYMVITDIL